MCPLKIKNITNPSEEIKMVKSKERDDDEHYDRRLKGADEKFCSSCGAIIKKEAELCPKCGVRQKQSSETNVSSSPKQIKSRVTAAVLAILLGGIGVHKFYIGKTGMGILYLIFFWTYIPMIIALIEGIIYLTSTKTDEEFTAKYVP